MRALLLTLVSIFRRRSPAPVRMVGLPLNISIPTRHRALVEARKNGKV